MYKEEIEAYKQCIRINPNGYEAHFNLGLVYLELKEMVSALEEYRILISLNPVLADKLFNLFNR
jgi:tetratricopeptide (TPR) repeat protein